MQEVKQSVIGDKNEAPEPEKKAEEKRVNRRQRRYINREQHKLQKKNEKWAQDELDAEVLFNGFKRFTDEHKKEPVVIIYPHEKANKLNQMMLRFRNVPIIFEKIGTEVLFLDRMPTREEMENAGYKNI